MSTLVTTIIGAFVLAALSYVVWWCYVRRRKLLRRLTLSDEQQREAAEVLEAHKHQYSPVEDILYNVERPVNVVQKDGSTALELTPTGDHIVPRVQRNRFAIQMAQLAQEEFGLLSRTRANELIVQRFIRDEARKRGVRTSHAVLLVPIAVEMAFVPGPGHWAAARLRASRPFREVAEAWNLGLDGRDGVERVHDMLLPGGNAPPVKTGAQ
jgi:hypothetical protein